MFRLCLATLALFCFASGAVQIFCEAEIKQRVPCSVAADEYNLVFSSAKEQNKRVVFLFGSKDCAPCNAWQKYFEKNSNEERLKVVRLPLSYRNSRGESVPNERIVQLCTKIMRDFAPFNTHIAVERQGLAPCLKKKPTMFMIDGETSKAFEIDGAYDTDGERAAHLKAIEEALKKRPMRKSGTQPAEAAT